MDRNNRYTSLNFVITREWIFQKVIHCVQTRNSAKTCGLLIIGGSGSGKTTICQQINGMNNNNNLISSGCNSENRLKQALLTSYFCNQSDAKSLSLSNFILHIHKFLLDSEFFRENYRQKLQLNDIKSLFDKENLISNPDKAFKNGILLPILSFPPPPNCNMFILIDSIDANLLANSMKYRKFSLINEKSRVGEGSATIADLICAHHHFFPEWLSVVCTCRRDNPLFIKQFTGFRKFQIDDLTKTYVVRDIQFYILTRIDCDNNLKRLINNQETELLNILHIKSNGYILYLEIILDLISNNFLTNIGALKSIPGTLSGLYLWIFDFVFADCEELNILKHIFSSLMATTLQPLSEQELFNVILNYDNSIDFQVIRGLINKIKYFFIKTNQNCYRFKHHSLPDWLLDVKMCTPKYKCSLSDGHALLALYFTQNAWRLSENEVKHFAFHLFASAPIFQLKSYHYSAWMLYSGCTLDINDDTVTSLHANFADLELEKVIFYFLNCFAHNHNDNADNDNEDIDSNKLTLYLKFTNSIKVVNKFYLKRKNNNLLQESTFSLHDAVRRNDLDQIRLILNQSNIDVNKNNNSGTTALMIAAQRGYEDVCKLLINYGAMIDILDRDEWTPLRLAIWNCHTGVVQIFLDCQKCQPDFAGRDNRTALRTASWVGNLEITRMLLEHGTDINKADSEGRTALMAATYRGNYEIIKYLLNKGADVNHRDNDGRNALFVAVLCLNNFTSQSDPNANQFTPNLNIVNLLLSYNVEINKPDFDGMTPLSIGAYEGNKELCELLLEHNADVDFVDRNSRTPLMAACLSGHVDVVRLMLFWGSAVHCLDKSGYSVLSICAAQGNISVLQELLARGLDEMHRDNRGFTPLHLAASEGHLQTVSILLKSGARPSETDDLNRLPLMLACQEGHVDIVKLLLHVWPESMNYKSLDGSTPLKIAIINEWPDIVALLLSGSFQFSISPNLYLQDNNGRTILQLLVLQNQLDWFLEVLSLCLCDYPQVIDMQDEDGRTALHLTAWKGDPEMVYRLLKTGKCNPAIRDNEGRTALHLAAWQGHLHECQLLIRYCAEIDCTCNQGATPLCIAAQEGHLDICCLLIKSGANIFHADDFNRTPYKVAFKGSHMEICKLLEQNGALHFLKN